LANKSRNTAIKTCASFPALGLKAYGQMRVSGKRATSVLAIYAIALHAILWGAVAPQIAASPLDPFAVICHSDPAAPTGQSPADPASAPAQPCDHCNLCSAAAAPATLVLIFVGQLAPARLLQILQPASTALGGHLATTPNLARGPPQFA
jgi:hypothetical protein